MATIAERWSEHVAASFPSECRGAEISGVDLVELDSFTAGCVSSFVLSGDRLERQHIIVLERCGCDLTRVLPNLKGESRVYFSRLEQLVADILRASGTRGR